MSLLLLSVCLCLCLSSSGLSLASLVSSASQKLLVSVFLRLTLVGLKQTSGFGRLRSRLEGDPIASCDGMWDLTSFYLSMFVPDLTNTQQPNIQQPKISTSTKEKERERERATQVEKE
jgi:hypothetical protein